MPMCRLERNSVCARNICASYDTRLAVQAHAVVLDLPGKLCAEQAVARQQHEGGVEGEGAARIAHTVASTLRREGLPGKAEGLSSVIVRNP